MKMPDARGEQNGKLEMASGKFRNCVGNYKARKEQNIKQLKKSSKAVYLSSKRARNTTAAGGGNRECELA